MCASAKWESRATVWIWPDRFALDVCLLPRWCGETKLDRALGGRFALAEVLVEGGERSAPGPAPAGSRRDPPTTHRAA